jgi:hypothetical protein
MVVKFNLIGEIFIPGYLRIPLLLKFHKQPKQQHQFS